MGLTAASTVVASREQVSTDLGGEAVILGLQDGIYYGLEAVGARIWTLIQEPRTLGAVRDAILSDYDVDTESCECDVRALVADLIDRGLAEVTDA